MQFGLKISKIKDGLQQFDFYEKKCLMYKFKGLNLRFNNLKSFFNN